MTHCSKLYPCLSPSTDLRGFVLGILLSVVSATGFAEVLFTDIAAESGIDPSDEYITSNSHGLGMIWIDYDEDGWPDLFAVNGFNQSPHLFHNNQDGTFSKSDELLPAFPNVEMSGSGFADYDNDGDSDIYIQVNHETIIGSSNSNPTSGPPNILLKNQWVENGGQIIVGEPLFVDVALEARVDGIVDVPFDSDYPAQRSVTGSWLDFDRDGCIDLYVGNWAIRHGGELSNMDTLYRNQCDGTFENVTVSSGVNDGVDPDAMRPTLAFIGAHLNDDPWPDMYAVNVAERMDPTGTPDPVGIPLRWFDNLFLNNADQTFTDVVPLNPGVGDDAAAGMGIDVADLDLDGDWDIYISDIDITLNDAEPLGNALYLGNPNGTWSDNSAVEAGVQGRFSWGVNFLDADHDGYEDLYVSVMPGVDPAASSNDILYMNDQDGTFTDVAVAAGIAILGYSRGSAVADFDRDGDLDVAVVETGGQLHLLRNDSTNAGHWLQLKLQANESNRDAIGTVVKIQAGSLTMMRQVKGGSSAHSQDDLVVHFGLADATSVDQVVVCWPGNSSGAKVDVLTNLAADTLHTVVEGANAQNVACDVDASPVLAVDSISPSTIVRGTEQVFTVTGQSFDPGINVNVKNSVLTPVTDIQFVDSTQLNVTINADAGAMLGFRTMRFRNPDDESVQVQAAFEVIIAPLEVTSVTPNTIAQGATEVFTIAGAGFVEGTAVRILNSPNTSVDNVVFVDGNTLSVTITADPAAVLGPKRIRVRNPDGETVIVTNAFTVVAP